VTYFRGFTGQGIRRDGAGCGRAKVLRTVGLAATLLAAVLGGLSNVARAQIAGLTETIQRIKPSVVGIGTYSALRRPPARPMGTAFVIADGRHVATGYHVVRDHLAPSAGERLVIFVGNGGGVGVRDAEVVAFDEDHDMAILSFTGAPLPPVRLGIDEPVEEGQLLAFTGYPMGSIYGFYPVTHRGILSAITPIVIPQISPQFLSAEMVRRLKGRFNVYQLDATAYPGNSGSPVYDVRTGHVLAVVSSVFVKESKEKILSEPSGITFATPIRYLVDLMVKTGLSQARDASPDTISGPPATDQ